MKYDEDYKEYCLNFGMHIKKLREERNITLKEISKITKIRTEYLKKIENGKAYGVKLEKHLLTIAQVLNVKLCTLFDF